MDKKEALETLKKMNDTSKQRKFTQSIEMMINFKGVNFKKPENLIDIRVEMPHATGKMSGRSLLFVHDKNFAAMIKGKVTKIVFDEEIPKLNKKDAAALASEFDIFMAEGAAMLVVGKHLGQILAPKGKMPSLVQANVESVQQNLTKLSTATRITNKKGKFMPLVHVLVGTEAMPVEHVMENMVAAYNAVVNLLPGKKQNIKSVFVKKTMGPAIKVIMK